MSMLSPSSAVAEATINSNGRAEHFSDLLTVLEKRRIEFDLKRHVPKDVVQLMKSCGIFRSSTPECFGGEHISPPDFLQMIDRIAQIDGSASWVAAFGSANTYYAALPIETQHVIYATGPDQVFAGGLYPPAPARRVEGGWVVSGRWRFASGCMGADWISVGLLDSENPKGGVLVGVCPAADVEIIPNWDMVGMQGTGSFDTQLKEKFIADNWVFRRGSSSTIVEPLYQYPLLSYQAQTHAASNLGLAQAAINVAIDMSGGKKIMPGAARLIDRAYFRTGLAQARAQLQSCRLYYYDAASKAWDVVKRGDELSPDLRNELRLSATNAAHTAAQVIQLIYRIAGMAAAEKSNRLQQVLRDSIVVTQHASLSEATLEQAGGVIAGETAPPNFL